MNDTLIAIVCIVFGLSFAYKAAVAIFLGRTLYWAGFLPITVFSPFFCHLPPGKNSLVKENRAWYVHVLLGPIFLLTSLFLLATGSDIFGLPGTQTLNQLLTLGKHDVPPAIVYEKGTGYKFPILVKAGDTIYKFLTSPLEMNPEKRLPGTHDQKVYNP